MSSISNPYKLQCSYFIYRKKVNLIKNTTFEKFSKSPIYLIINALELFISEIKNATNTIKKINDKYKLSTFGRKSIYSLFKFIRKCIAQYLNDVYQNEKTLDDNQFKNIAIDESLFAKNNHGK